MTELKNMLLKANQEEVKKLDSFKAQPEYLLNFASKLAEKDLRILVYCTRKNKSKFLKIFIGDYLISRPAYSKNVEKDLVMFSFEGFDAKHTKQRSSQFKFFEDVKNELKI